MPAGRNAPCPCGSGKKHKKCCLPARSGKDFDSYADLRMTEGLLASRILRFARTRFGEEVGQEASIDFHLHREDLVGERRHHIDGQVHVWILRHGLAHVQTLPKAEAQRRVGMAHTSARLHGYPLQFTIEQEE